MNECENQIVLTKKNPKAVYACLGLGSSCASTNLAYFEDEPERDVYETHAAEESWSKIVAMWDRNLK